MLLLHLLLLPLVAGQVSSGSIEDNDFPSYEPSSTPDVNANEGDVSVEIEISATEEETRMKRHSLPFSHKYQLESAIEGSGEVGSGREERKVELLGEGWKKRHGPFSKLYQEKFAAVEGSGEMATTRDERDVEPEIIPVVKETSTPIPEEPIPARRKRMDKLEEKDARTTIGEEERRVMRDADDFIIEGSGESENSRTVRQAEAGVVLGNEQPVEEEMQKRPDGRPRPPTPSNPSRPSLTCETVDCIRGTTCVMENGRPVCKSFPTPSQPSESRTCRDVSCPRDTRCRMVRDDRCRGRDCPDQPICVREEREASCRRVECPSGTRCVVRDEPGCFGDFCRQVATCINPCNGVRCPFGTSCQFDGRDAICNPVVINPCLTVRCPNGFECRAVQNQPQCFAISTPAPTLPPTTPSPCAGQNEEFASCATFCEPNCVEKNPACITACAAPRCQCANGFYRNQQGVCVPAEQCEFTPPCGLNESFMECSTLCEPKCGQPVNIACPAMCGPAKCQCKQGFWRHQSGSCVQQNQCFFG